MPVTATTFIAYYRVSTDRQGKSGLGLEAQRAAVEAFARQQGGTFGAEFVEVGSRASATTGPSSPRPSPPRAKGRPGWSSPSSTGWRVIWRSSPP